MAMTLAKSSHTRVGFIMANLLGEACFQQTMKNIFLELDGPFACKALFKLEPVFVCEIAFNFNSCPGLKTEPENRSIGDNVTEFHPFENTTTEQS